MLRKLYLSKFGFIISLILNFLSKFHKPFMVYGYFNRVQKKFYKNSRISSTAKLINKEKIDINDNVWVGHYSLIDGIGGVKIGEGVHVASHSVIYSHSSQNTIRYLGKEYINIPAEKRIGYIFQEVVIGNYSFIGTSSVILPGTKIGKGCVVGAGSIVKGVYPDYSIIVGNPAKIVGDTRDIDSEFMKEHNISQTYYNKEILEELKHWKQNGNPVS